MGMFSSDKGFVHIVFAHEDDDYYLDNLACLNMNQFLYYKLKQEYDGIYFIGGNIEAIQLIIPDSKSCEIYDASKEKHRFINIFSKSNEVKTLADTKINIDKEELDEFRTRIFRILRKENKQAFVFTLESFQDIFRDEDKCAELCSLKKRCLGKNVIVIQTPPILISNLEAFTAENSVFNTELFSFFSCEGSSRNDKIFKRLNDLMGGCCTYLNRLDLDKIRRMVRSVVLESNDMENTKPAFVDDYADFIYCWYHSPKLRQLAEGLLPQNERQRIRDIKNEIKSPGVFKDMESWIVHFRQNEDNGISLRKIIEKKFLLSEEENFIFMDSPLIRKLDSVNIPEDIDNKHLKYFMDIMEELRIPKGSQYEIENDKTLKEYAEQLKIAGSKEKSQTFEKVLNALRFEILEDKKDLNQTDIEDIRDSYKQIIKMIILCNAFQDKIEENNKNLANLNEEFDVVNAQVLDRDYSRIGNISVDDLHNINLRDKAVDININIRNIKQINSDNEKQLNVYMDIIFKWEQYIIQRKNRSMTIEEMENALNAFKEQKRKLDYEMENMFRYGSEVQSISYDERLL